MQLHHGRAQRYSRFELPPVGIDEERNADIRLAEPVHDRLEMIVKPRRVEPAFGCHFLAPFGHDAAGMGLVPKRNAQHFRRRRHFEVERQPHLVLEPRNIAIADMPPVLAQMRCYALRARRGGKFCRPHRIRVFAATRVTDRRHMIDIDAEPQISRLIPAHIMSPRLVSTVPGLPACSGPACSVVLLRERTRSASSLRLCA